MFLTRFRALSRVSRDERGSVLMGVIGLMAVTLILVVVIAATTLNALAFTTSTRAGVQSVAAAESGVNQVVASVQTGACPAGGVYVSNTDPVYTAQLSWSAGTDLNSASWTSGCPTTAAQLLRIEATGQAAAPGVASNNTGNVSSVEAIYSMTMPSAGVDATGAAIYAYSSGGFSGSGGVAQGSGTVPSVQIWKGDVSCSGGSPAYADIIIANGKFIGSGGCQIYGNIWASGSITTSGDVPISGNLVAGTSMSIISTVGGSVWAPQGVLLGEGASVAGNATSSTKLTFQGGIVRGTAWSGNAAVFSQWNVHLPGRLVAKTVTNGKNGTAAGGIFEGAAWYGPGPATPPMPLVPHWIDYNYDHAANWSGFVPKKISGDCTFAVLKTAVEGLMNARGVIDARDCDGKISLGNSNSLELGSDVGIIAKGFTLGAGASITAASPHKLWLIVPDLVDNDKPDCVSGGEFLAAGGFKMSDKVGAIVYTPCNITISAGVKWRGQIYGNETKIDGDASVHFSPIGLPGINMDDGLPSGGGGPIFPVLSSRESIRDVAQ